MVLNGFCITFTTHYDREARDITRNRVRHTHLDRILLFLFYFLIVGPYEFNHLQPRAPFAKSDTD